MTSLKVLSAAAAMALMLPMAAPTEGFAQNIGARAGGGGPGGGGAAVGGGGRGGMAIGGGGGMRAGGGAIGGGGLAVSPGASRGGFAGGAIGGGGPSYSGGGSWQGGGYGHRGHRHHRGYGGFGTGLVIGGALGSSYGYYGAPYGYGYYDDGYYDEPVVAVVPGGDDIEYCRRTYRSYDVRSGTYLGYDGLRHACP